MENIYLEGVKNDIQFDGVLSADGVIYLACVGERDEYQDGNDYEKCTQEVRLLRWGKRRCRRGEKVSEQAGECKKEAYWEDCECVKK